MTQVGVPQPHHDKRGNSGTSTPNGMGEVDFSLSKNVNHRAGCHRSGTSNHVRLTSRPNTSHRDSLGDCITSLCLQAKYHIPPKLGMHDKHDSSNGKMHAV